MITDMNIGTKMPEKVMFSIETEWISFLPLLKSFCHFVANDFFIGKTGPIFLCPGKETAKAHNDRSSSKGAKKIFTLFQYQT